MAVTSSEGVPLMSIRKNPRRKRNPWECRWVEDGRHHSRSFPSRRDAEAFDVERKSSLHSGRYLRASDDQVTLDDYAQKYLSQKRKASTVQRNRGIYDRYISPVLGTVRIRAIRHSDIQRLVDSWSETGLSPRTITRQVAVLSKIFTLAERDGVIHRIPTRGLDVPEPNDPHRYSMTLEEVDGLLGAIHANYRAFLYVLIETGMRIGEAIGLQIDDFDWVDGTLSITDAKTKAGVRTVRISKTAVNLVSAHISATGRNMANSSEPLFVSHREDESGRITGTRINYSNFRTRIFRPAAAAIGLPDLQIHDLRRTAASILVSQGTPHKVIQERLGHADVRTTFNLYAQAPAEDHDVAVSRLEQALAGHEETVQSEREQA